MRMDLVAYFVRGHRHVPEDQGGTATASGTVEDGKNYSSLGLCLRVLYLWTSRFEQRMYLGVYRQQGEDVGTPLDRRLCA